MTEQQLRRIIREEIRSGQTLTENVSDLFELDPSMGNSLWAELSNQDLSDVPERALVENIVNPVEDRIRESFKRRGDIERTGEGRAISTKLAAGVYEDGMSVIGFVDPQSSGIAGFEGHPREGNCVAMYVIPREQSGTRLFKGNVRRSRMKNSKKWGQTIRSAVPDVVSETREKTSKGLMEAAGLFNKPASVLRRRLPSYDSVFDTGKRLEVEDGPDLATVTYNHGSRSYVVGGDGMQGGLAQEVFRVLNGAGFSVIRT
jgi:hypothetical protein